MKITIYEVLMFFMGFFVVASCVLCFCADSLIDFAGAIYFILVAVSFGVFAIAVKIIEKE